MNDMKDAASPNSSAVDGKALWGEAKEAVAQVADSASEKLKRGLDARKEKAAETAEAVATAIRETGEGLRDVGPLPDLADQAADQIEKLAKYVQSRNLGDMVREVERFARREPAIFLGASFAVWLIGGRFMKASVPPATPPRGRSRLQRRRHDADIEVRPARPIRSAVGANIEVETRDAADADPPNPRSKARQAARSGEGADATVGK